VTTELPTGAFAAALAGINGLGPVRLERLLARWTPEEAWSALRASRASGVWGASESPKAVEKAGQLVDAAVRAADPGRLWARCQAVGVAVHLRGAPSYPAVLEADLSPPPILFSRGDLGALEGRRVTVVGTRNASAAGREVAAELGRGLAEHGVRVVSGLARGIDGWAHRGALAAEGGAPPVAVVASGPDVVYPPEHRPLWQEVVARGLLLSEVPPGVAPHAHRFPLRNRILAALGEVVLVVESRHRGGSLLTVDAATDRGITVLAVPGSPRNPAAEGTNQLLLDGATPVVSTVDVLDALGWRPSASAVADDDAAEPAAPERHRRRAAAGAGRSMTPASIRPAADGWALDALGTEPHDLDHVVRASGRTLLDVVDALQRLEELGLVRRRAGWFERVPASAVRRT
jgi:DNA processing protein